MLKLLFSFILHIVISSKIIQIKDIKLIPKKTKRERGAAAGASGGPNKMNGIKVGENDAIISEPIYAHLFFLRQLTPIAKVITPRNINTIIQKNGCPPKSRKVKVVYPCLISEYIWKATFVPKNSITLKSSSIIKLIILEILWIFSEMIIGLSKNSFRARMSERKGIKTNSEGIAK